ncbi:unnamed protein product, partial [Ectocarpus sp. 13 AM-2016]
QEKQRASHKKSKTASLNHHLELWAQRGQARKKRLRVAIRRSGLSHPLSFLFALSGARESPDCVCVALSLRRGFHAPLYSSCTPRSKVEALSKVQGFLSVLHLRSPCFAFTALRWRPRCPLPPVSYRYPLQ